MFNTTLALLLITGVLSTVSSRHASQLGEEGTLQEHLESDRLTVQESEGEEGAFFGWMYRGREINQ